jgi:hypothetical protein
MEAVYCFLWLSREPERELRVSTSGFKFEEGWTR